MKSVMLPLRIESVANLREHRMAAARRAKLHRKTAWALIPKFDLPCVVTLIRVAPRMLDLDNCISGFKATRDGVADKLGVKDNDPRVEWRYRQERGEPKQYAVHVILEAA